MNSFHSLFMKLQSYMNVLLKIESFCVLVSRDTTLKFHSRRKNFSSYLPKIISSFLYIWIESCRMEFYCGCCSLFVITLPFCTCSGVVFYNFTGQNNSTTLSFTCVISNTRCKYSAQTLQCLCGKEIHDGDKNKIMYKGSLRKIVKSVLFVKLMKHSIVYYFLLLY